MGFILQEIGCHKPVYTSITISSTSIHAYRIILPEMGCHDPDYTNIYYFYLHLCV